MNFMTLQDAAFALVILSTIIIPWATSELSKVTWPSIYKTLIVLGLSILFGGLKAYADGDITEQNTLVGNICIVFVAAHLAYITLFKQFGAEKYINPKAALATYAKQQVKEQIEKMPESDVKEILDIGKSASIDVQVTKKE